MGALNPSTLRNTRFIDAVSGAAYSAEELSRGIAVEVWRNDAQSIDNDTLTAITWQAGSANTDFAKTYFDAAAPTLITFQEPGLYVVTLSVAFAADADGYRMVNLQKVGYDGNASAGNITVPSAGAGIKTQLVLNTIVKASAAGNQLKAQVRHTAGAALDLDVTWGAEAFGPDLMVTKIASQYLLDF